MSTWGLFLFSCFCHSLSWWVLFHRYVAKRVRLRNSFSLYGLPVCYDTFEDKHYTCRYVRESASLSMFLFVQLLKISEFVVFLWRGVASDQYSTSKRCLVTRTQNILIVNYPIYHFCSMLGEESDVHNLFVWSFAINIWMKSVFNRYDKISWTNSMSHLKIASFTVAYMFLTIDTNDNKKANDLFCNKHTVR